jgi:hypothetical protein
MINTGRYGTVKLAVTPGSPEAPTEILSLNAWKLSLKTAKEDITCFQDPNKVYVPGIPDVSGSLGGLFNSSELRLVAAANANVPGFLQLGNDSVGDPTILFSGLAWMDCDIDCSLAAPKITGTFMAGGPWTLPIGA